MKSYEDGLEDAARVAERGREKRDPADDYRSTIMVDMSGDEIAAAIRALPVPPKPEDTSFLPMNGAVYRNRKTGGLYLVLATGRMEATRELVTIYQPLDGLMTWVRPTAEFGERFDYVPNGETAEEPGR